MQGQEFKRSVISAVTIYFLFRVKCSRSKIQGHGAVVGGTVVVKCNLSISSWLEMVVKVRDQGKATTRACLGDSGAMCVYKMQCIKFILVGKDG